MTNLRVGYTKGKKTKNKKVEIIFLQINHGYTYAQLRDMIKTKKGITGKIHISYANKIRRKIA
jgi:hypothetical protein